MRKLFVCCLATAGFLAACEKTAPAHWIRITKERPCAAATLPAGAGSVDCKAGVFLLDTASVTKKSGLLYVTLQTRVDGELPGGAGGDYGIIHAEANCRSRKLEPTGLHEDRYSRDGRKIESRLAVISAEDEESIVQYVCSGFDK